MMMVLRDINMKKLLGRPEVYGQNAFPDAYLVTACWIEDSLVQGGAKPGKDYTILDLYKLAQPFILSRYQKGELTDFK
jgi:hypothetical protein